MAPLDLWAKLVQQAKLDKLEVQGYPGIQV